MSWSWSFLCLCSVLVSLPSGLGLWSVLVFVSSWSCYPSVLLVSCSHYSLVLVSVVSLSRFRPSLLYHYYKYHDMNDLILRPKTVTFAPRQSGVFTHGKMSPCNLCWGVERVVISSKDKLPRGTTAQNARSPLHTDWGCFALLPAALSTLMPPSHPCTLYCWGCPVPEVTVSCACGLPFAFTTPSKDGTQGHLAVWALNSHLLASSFFLMKCQQ